MLALDLGIFQRHAHVVTKKEALTWTIVWVVCAAVFAVGVHRTYGAQKSLEFVTGYVIEKALSVDNLFVFLVIFSSFAVPPQIQRTVLLWGLLGALVMRATFIAAGAALLRRFHWLMYGLGAFLVYTAVALVTKEEQEIEPGQHWVVRLVRRVIPVSSKYEGERFFVRRQDRWMATPLLVVLAVVECTDLVFALDSIPAIFGITTDTLIVYTSNVFAILGLRALYFLLAGVMSQFRFMKEGLATVLGFVGMKMLVEDLFDIPITFSLGFIAAALTMAVVASLRYPAERALDPGSDETVSQDLDP
ncbi:MAG: TerC family protein [Candidatus Wallbacteria bacterium]|nr:TerC family protein [Candidatus Wallbacteria bacterium]